MNGTTSSSPALRRARRSFPSTEATMLLSKVSRTLAMHGINGWIIQPFINKFSINTVTYIYIYWSKSFKYNH